MERRAEDYGKLLRWMFRAEVEMADQPHVLIIEESAARLVTYQGPYATGFDALVAAERITSSVHTEVVAVRISPVLPADAPWS